MIERKTHVIRTAIVAAVMPSNTSDMNASRVWVCCVWSLGLRSPQGTSSGRVACKNWCSWALVSTIFRV